MEKSERTKKQIRNNRYILEKKTTKCKFTAFFVFISISAVVFLIAYFSYYHDYGDKDTVFRNSTADNLITDSLIISKSNVEDEIKFCNGSKSVKIELKEENNDNKTKDNDNYGFHRTGECEYLLDEDSPSNQTIIKCPLTAKNIEISIDSNSSSSCKKLFNGQFEIFFVANSEGKLEEISLKPVLSPEDQNKDNNNEKDDDDDKKFHWADLIQRCALEKLTKKAQDGSFMEKSDEKTLQSIIQTEDEDRCENNSWPC